MTSEFDRDFLPSLLAPILCVYEAIEQLDSCAFMDKEDIAFLEREVSMRWFRNYIQKQGAERAAMLITDLIERSVTK